ncbi:MAG TPA: adenylosuccinate synthetase [Anaerolineales bacterium]|jgi:adenylosuccinate synthase
MDPSEKQAILIADLGFGDAGKGSIVDFLTRSSGAHTVVRYNGGAQAAHNVVTPDGRQHTFAQFGSGTFLPGTRTYLSRFMITHPLAMLAEERHLYALGVRDAFARLAIDRQALVTTPFQQSANRVKEMLRGGARHGSCGLGVGESMADWLALGDEMLMAGDLPDRGRVIKKLKLLQEVKWEQIKALLPAGRLPGEIEAEVRIFHDPELIPATAEVFGYFAGLVSLTDEAYARNLAQRTGVTIFEGAQGVLLDEWFGFYPYNSWSTYTFKNAESLLTESGFDGETLKLGLLRGYATRHGAGPFVSEDVNMSARLPDIHNGDNPWQHGFRVGWLDLVALRYALRVIGKLDGLAVTNLDRMESLPEWQVCEAYTHPDGGASLEEHFSIRDGLVQEIRLPGDPTDLVRQERLTRLLLEMQPVYSTREKDSRAYLEGISQALEVPVSITSRGETALDKEIVAKVGMLEKMQPV